MRGYSLRLALSDYLRSKPTCANFTKAHSNNHSTDTGLDISCIFCCFSRRHLLHYHEPLYISPTDPLARPDERDLETNKAQSASEPHPNHLELAASASPVQAAEHIPQGPPSLTSSPPQRHSRSASPTPPPRPPDLQYSFFSFSARVSRLGHPIPQHPELMSPSSSTSSSRKPEDLDAHVTGLRLARSVLAALEAELSARMSVAEAGRAVGYALKYVGTFHFPRFFSTTSISKLTNHVIQHAGSCNAGTLSVQCEP